MSRDKTILAGDIHLLKKPGMWQGRAEIAGDDVYALEQIVKLTHENDADLVLLGDVFDSVTNLPRPIAVANELLGPLAAEGRVRFIQGQHELVVQAHYENYPWLSLVKGAEHVGQKSFRFYGLRAFGMDYFPQAFEGLAFSHVPDDVQVLFMHGTIDLASSIGYHFKAESLFKFKHLQYVFAGDWHQTFKDHVEIDGRKVPIMYTGAMWQQAENEQRDKSVILVTQEKGPLLKTNRVPLKTRKIVKISELTNDDGSFDMEKLEKDLTVPAALQMPVILVDMPTAPNVYEDLAKFAHLYTTSGANPDTPTREVVEQFDSLTDDLILSRYVDKEKNPEEFAFTLDVIQHPAEDAIARLKSKMGIATEDHTTASTDGEINLDADEEETVEEEVE